MALDVYDGSFNRSGSGMDISLGGNNNQSVTTIYTVYNRNPTPLDISQPPTGHGADHRGDQ